MSIQHELVSKIQNVLRDKYGGVGPVEREKLFNDYDADGNGSIDSDELEKILADAQIGNALTRKFWVRGVMARMDADRNGTIEFNEFEEVIADAKTAAAADAPTETDG